MQNSNKLTCKSYLQILYSITSLAKSKEVTSFYDFMSYEFMIYHAMNSTENVRIVSFINLFYFILVLHTRHQSKSSFNP